MGTLRNEDNYKRAHCIIRAYEYRAARSQTLFAMGYDFPTNGGRRGKAKTYFLVDAKIDDQLATERLIIYKRGRKISRDGMYPQPVTELKKY